MKCPFEIRSIGGLNIPKGKDIIRIEGGSECIFIQLTTGKWAAGLKLFYKDRDKAVRSYRRQDRASDFFLAPIPMSHVYQYKVTISRDELGKLDKRDIISASAIFQNELWADNYPKNDTFIFYGYITEAVNMIHHRLNKTPDRIRSLRMMLNTCVFKKDGFGDLLAGNNCGWSGDELVAIDFGDLSV
jgi:hypothetical protein